ncbi:MAG: RNA 2',3'-cyclic phosphodiesterase, partial [Candidatus Thorarchaeota archaeon]
MSSTSRVFLSVDIEDDELLSRIAHIQSKLDRQSAKMKIVEREKIHFTLRFLGDTSHTKLEEIRESLSGIQFSPFTIRINGIGAFPNASRPRVIWVGVTENADKITNLKLEMDDLLGNLGYSRDRKFHAHATIARVRAVHDRSQMVMNIESLASEAVGTMSVECFRMTKSTLTSSGPIYETLWEV